ncbi:acyl-CoA dehydrogenase family protein [Rhodococcus sp. NCIMB 12038]|uniref:acyl-CoA dehydrogenase family protein n=1 Tax=Rhodococcus sp. NCIMB 12038 TaxID=933800 RepID=UPI000B3C59A1|nr:acyl-CoA dehydrogenase family protein [Rhodococcus sp. NCIMB 12038]OUS83983.1 hypothetical protein CA951_40575 [Rhodococcus sp. NCIMB 12038]
MSSSTLESGTAREASAPPLRGSFAEKAHQLAPTIESVADEIEGTGKIAPEVVDALRSDGLFWAALPPSEGGTGNILDFVEVTEAISFADASTGWITMASSVAAYLMTGYMPAEGPREMFGGPTKGIPIGHAFPGGKGVRVEGGFRVTGQWPFASGCSHADWFGVGFAVVDDAGDPVLDANGKKITRFGAADRGAVTILPNWDVTGLKGTGSHDMRVEEAFIPDRRVMDAYSIDPVRSEGIFLIGKDAFAVAGHAAVALGVMRRALREVAVITRGKPRRGYPVPVDEYPVFQFEFAKADAAYQSARAYLVTTCAEAQRQATEELHLTDEIRVRMQHSATHAHHALEQVISFARIWAASQAFRNPSALGRAVRDANVVTQHLLIDNITAVDAGKSLVRMWQDL